MLVDARTGEANGAQRIAVVGSGISGLSAAWLLSRRHQVTVYEAESRLGGHSHTVMAPAGRGEVAVDTGFIVYNERNYPNLVALFDHLGVATQRSSMSFSASLDGGKLEYSSDGLNAVFGQRRNLVSPRFLGMVRDIVRFYADARSLLNRPELEALTLGQYLDRHNYTAAFVEDHLLPMGAAIWSTTAAQMRDYPLFAFVNFFIHHGLLDLVNRPKWRTVTGGSREYVRRLAEGLSGGARVGSGVASVRREAHGVTITDVHGHADRFDAVVIATHADQALAMLSDPDAEERALLGAFRYTDNLAVLHADTTLMPKRERVWAAWNYVGENADNGERPLCVTYWMNRLQNLDPQHPLFVTLNPTRQVAEGKLIQSFNYTHPLFDRAAIEAQQQLWRLQGQRSTYFAGSYFGAGFHEDALQSGLAAAEAVGGVRRPWQVAGESSRITLQPVLEAAE